MKGVEFYNFQENDTILDLMGIQDRGDITLIRHTYVCTQAPQKGIGGKLLQ